MAKHILKNNASYVLTEPLPAAALQLIVDKETSTLPVGEYEDYFYVTFATEDGTAHEVAKCTTLEVTDTQVVYTLARTAPMDFVVGDVAELLVNVENLAYYLTTELYGLGKGADAEYPRVMSWKDITKTGLYLADKGLPSLPGSKESIVFAVVGSLFSFYILYSNYGSYIYSGVRQASANQPSTWTPMNIPVVGTRDHAYKAQAVPSLELVDNELTKLSTAVKKAADDGTRKASKSTAGQVYIGDGITSYDTPLPIVVAGESGLGYVRSYIRAGSDPVYTTRCVSFGVYMTSTDFVDPPVGSSGTKGMLTTYGHVEDNIPNYQVNEVDTTGRQYYMPCNSLETWARTYVASKGDGSFPSFGPWVKVSSGEEAAAPSFATPIGMISFLPFRFNALPVGWYFCNGTRYNTTTTLVGAALKALPTIFKTDWAMTLSGSGAAETINLPNWFYGGRGPTMRGVDGSSRQVGSVEDGAIQNITGTARCESGKGNSFGYFDGVFASDGVNGVAGNLQNTPYGYYGLTINVSRQVATANEVRMINRGMTPAIFLGV